MIWNLVGHWGLGLPIGWTLAFVAGWGVVGIWIGLSTSLIVVGDRADAGVGARRPGLETALWRLNRTTRTSPSPARCRSPRILAGGRASRRRAERRPLPLLLAALLRAARARRCPRGATARRPRRAVRAARLGRPRLARRAGRSLGRRARSLRRRPRHADCQHARRRRLGGRGGGPASRALRRRSSWSTRSPPTPLARPRARSARPGLRVVCLFPAMHRYSLADPQRAPRSSAPSRDAPGAALFVHCGVLSVGVRRKLGLPSRFDLRFGNPLDVQRFALDYPEPADHRAALRRRASSARR